VINDTNAKVWPNGEFSLWREKRLKEVPLVREVVNDSSSLKQCLIRSEGNMGAIDALRALGLSKDSNLDNIDSSSSERPRYGLSGLTSSGARKLRNGAYLMQKRVTRKYLTFATITLPSSLTDEQADKVHENWGKIMNSYQREMRRELRRNDLVGEMAGCSEIQPGRFEDSGKPWLHAHYVFQGRKRGAGWAISTNKHDEIFWRALNSVINISIGDCCSCCNLQPVRKDASQYLSKYMSKGTKEIKQAISAGYELWLPKQWYFMTRSLLQSVRREIKQGENIAVSLEVWRYDFPTAFRYWKDIFVSVDGTDDYGIWVGASGAIDPALVGVFISVLS
jgi:hypothetical protein